MADDISAKEYVLRVCGKHELLDQAAFLGISADTDDNSLEEIEEWLQLDAVSEGYSGGLYCVMSYLKNVRNRIAELEEVT